MLFAILGHQRIQNILIQYQKLKYKLGTIDIISLIFNKATPKFKKLLLKNQPIEIIYTQNITITTKSIQSQKPNQKKKSPENINQRRLPKKHLDTHKNQLRQEIVYNNKRQMNTNNILNLNISRTQSVSMSNYSHQSHHSNVTFGIRDDIQYYSQTLGNRNMKRNFFGEVEMEDESELGVGASMMFGNQVIKNKPKTAKQLQRQAYRKHIQQHNKQLQQKAQKLKRLDYSIQKNRKFLAQTYRLLQRIVQKKHAYCRQESNDQEEEQEEEGEQRQVEKQVDKDGSGNGSGSAGKRNQKDGEGSKRGSVRHRGRTSIEGLDIDINLVQEMDMNKIPNNIINQQLAQSIVLTSSKKLPQNASPHSSSHPSNSGQASQSQQVRQSQSLHNSEPDKQKQPEIKIPSKPRPKNLIDRIIDRSRVIEPYIVGDFVPEAGAIDYYQRSHMGVTAHETALSKRECFEPKIKIDGQLVFQHQNFNSSKIKSDSHIQSRNKNSSFLLTLQSQPNSMMLMTKNGKNPLLVHQSERQVLGNTWQQKINPPCTISVVAVFDRFKLPSRILTVVVKKTNFNQVGDEELGRGNMERPGRLSNYEEMANSMSNASSMNIYGYYN